MNMSSSTLQVYQVFEEWSGHPEELETLWLKILTASSHPWAFLMSSCILFTSFYCSLMPCTG